MPEEKKWRARPLNHNSHQNNSYYINPEYRDTLIPYHTYSKIWIPILLQWTLVTMTAFITKDVAIKMNLLLHRILNEQIDM